MGTSLSRQGGEKGRVFHTTQGASQDILDDNYRRLVVNGIFWVNGLEREIREGNTIDFVGEYKPRTFRMKGHARGVKPADLRDMVSPIMPEKGMTEKGKTPSQKDAKHTKITDEKLSRPPKDAKLKKYFISNQSPRPQVTSPVKTTLPLKLEEGATIALVGNLLLDTERRNGHLESIVQQAFPQSKLRFRNFAWPADEVDLMPRPDKYGDLEQNLFYVKPDVIIAAYGYNESFAGEAGVEAFKKRLAKFVSGLKSKAFNGKSAPQVVLLSPVANEDVAQVNAGSRNNGNIALYSQAMREVAAALEVGFVDVFEPTKKMFSDGSHTRDGHALNARGYALFAQSAFEGIFGKKAPEVNEDMRKLVVDKAFHFDQRYRAVNSFYYTGGRAGAYGYLDFLPAMRNFDIMVTNRDKAIHLTANGEEARPDDSKVPPLDRVAQGRGANTWHSPEDELKAFKVDPRFEVNCFASEKDFPELACPISMRWDSKGRLWVSTSTTYPHVYPGQKPADKILILEDTDQDGKADKCKTFASGLHMPLSFVLDDKGGVYVSELPHLTYLQDIDGDDVADRHEIVATGFGMEDSHHALHDFIWTPGGELIFRESVFHNTQVETPYGPVRARNSAWFRYDPLKKKLSTFGNYPNTNPWGVAFDRHGHHVASHPVFASTFHATNRVYPAQHPGAKGIQAYSGVCGHGFVDSKIWPEEMQGGFIKNRYKPTNKVEFHQWTQMDDHYAEKFVFDIIFSSDLSFIPVDFQFGPRGAAYVCDWYNPIKGHMQYSLRDPRRDRHSGRIWRIVPKGAKLGPAARTDGKSVADLLDMLNSQDSTVTGWVRRALRARGASIEGVLGRWVNAQGSEAMKLQGLWVYQGIGVINEKLLGEVISSSDPIIAAAGYTTLRSWASEMRSADVERLLRMGAESQSQHVRREAVIAASYVGSAGALEAVLPVLDQEAGVHLSYAIHSAIESEALSKHWRGGAVEQRVQQGLKNLRASGKKPEKKTQERHPFDQKKGLQEVLITCVPERLMFDKKRFTVKAGQPVKLTLDNPDATQHNLLILDRGASVSEVGMAANEMAKSPEGMKKHFVPDDKRILFSTKLVGEHQKEVLRFIAPTKPGEYPFICSFPGHWSVMKGVMVVK
ncbi:PVC-type heme-binding CxxCH protein [Rubritalea tangerina]|uniref:PVC-type heme-binding CxxCH protein n=1 Tax=Rubritalea tangerina TaxID=430798 RepID=UPI00362201F4